MAILNLALRSVVTVPASTSLIDAARLMRLNETGCVVVNEDSGDGSSPPVGMITDRDLVVKGFGGEASFSSVTVGDIMSREPVSVLADIHLQGAIEVMRTHGVRRLVVVDHGGNVVGLIFFEDLLMLLTDELDSLSDLLADQRDNDTSKDTNKMFSSQAGPTTQGAAAPVDWRVDG
jgi:CBS domain-containing protein